MTVILLSTGETAGGISWRGRRQYACCLSPQWWEHGKVTTEESRQTKPAKAVRRGSDDNNEDEEYSSCVEVTRMTWRKRNKNEKVFRPQIGGKHDYLDPFFLFALWAEGGRLKEARKTHADLRHDNIEGTVSSLLLLVEQCFYI